MRTIIAMKIDFDPHKDSLNLAAHGVSLAMAERLEWDLMRCREDDREDYGELRLQCFAPIGDSLYYVVCVEEDDQYRIISLRKATKPEVKSYANQI